MESEFPSVLRPVLSRINELPCNRKQPYILPLSFLKRNSWQSSDSRDSVTFKTLDKTSFMIFGTVFDANVKAIIQSDLWSVFLHQSSKTRCLTRYSNSFNGKLISLFNSQWSFKFWKWVHKTRILDGISIFLKDKK